MIKRLFILLFIQLWAKSLTQHSPFSLQTAVEALHRREEQLALKNNNLNKLQDRYGPSDDNEYWDGDSELSYPHTGRLHINQILAKQLARDRNFNIKGVDDENYLEPIDEKKRSFFRERDEKYSGPPSYPTVFRERELEPYKQSELAEAFLREIQNENELKREHRYRDTLRDLWDNYQQQENQIKQDLFDLDFSDTYDNDGVDSNKRKLSTLKLLNNLNDNNDNYYNNKNNDLNTYYNGPSMDRKRSYPVLPWLPASKKKRFPVTKRSPKTKNDDSNVIGTDEKVAKDLQAIFGQPKQEKKKRSTDNDDVSTKNDQKSKPSTNEQTSNNNKHAIEHDHTYHGKHGEHNSDEEHEIESEEHDEHEHDDENEDEHDHDFDDDEENDDKKKREVPTKKRINLEIIKEDQIIPGDLNEVRDKKSIQWSKYFGIDRKKKSDWYRDSNNNNIADDKKRTTEKLLENDNDTKERKDIDPEKLENMNNKLKSIEDYIIDETIKYTGAHQGITDQDEIRHLKDRVVSRLATAYNLEKMRTALEKLRESLDNENHLQRNKIEFDYKNQNEKDKRVAIKKEKAEYDSNQHSTDSSTVDKSENVPSNNLDASKDEKKKRKRDELQQYSDGSDTQLLNLADFDANELGAGHYDILNDNHIMMGGKNLNNDLGNGNIQGDTGFSSNQCSLLDSIREKCRDIDILSGDIHQVLLPICNIHQLCYLCGTSQVACDFQYLSEADLICGYNYECQSDVRSALMILRGSSGLQLGLKECLKNPCLYKAIKEIGL